MTTKKNVALCRNKPRCIETMVFIALLFLMHSPRLANANDLRLEDMYLKQNKTDWSVEVLMRSSVEAGFLGEIQGYDLSKLRPFAELYSENHYVVSGARVTDTRTDESFAIPIYKACYDDGTIVLAEKDDRGNIVYVELRRAKGTPDMFLIPAAKGDPHDDEYLSEESEFVAFSDVDVDFDELRSKYQYGEASLPDSIGDSDRRFLRSKSNREGRDGRSEFLVSSSFSSNTIISPIGSVGCQSYRVVKIAVIFDAEFCALYGSFEASRRRIMTIVASASFLYERDMCVKLELTNIFSPETSCSRGNSYFERGSFYRYYPCGEDESFLSQFAKWTKKNRRNLGIDQDATVHMFSGYAPPGGTIGCAFVGSYCDSRFSYGIEYMSFAMNPLLQGVVLAHEMGHVLNAPHLYVDSNSQHVMEPNINNAQDGFSIYSINSILNFLNSDYVTCDGFAYRAQTRLPTPAPTGRPTAKPTTRPTSAPTPAPTDKPTARPTLRPTPSPTLHAVQSPTSTLVEQPDNSKCSMFQDDRVPACVYRSKGEARYACIDSSSVVDASATSACAFPTPITRIVRCEGRLRSGQSLDNNKSDFFSSASCGASCVVVADSLCFRADVNEQAYTISFMAVADFDVYKLVHTNVYLKDNDGTDSCAFATSDCVK